MHLHLTLIGLTGGIACGKSTVLAMLHDLGAHVLDADAVTHALQRPEGAAYAPIVAAFGPQVVAADGTLDRRALGSIVFSDAARLRELEAIVHPLVRREIAAWLERVAAEHPGAVAVLDVIRLIEGGYAAQCDAVWVVRCAAEQQLARLMQTRGLSEPEARARLAAQPPQESRIAHATLIIDNDGDLDDLRAQVLAGWRGGHGAIP